ncbi:hypothetical protein ACHAWU_005439 [Discostella pseudostelligera]|uniref:Thioredoxin domain-containing protein n=1 Tax=Discostella pseudostelligera TaxID=259834 RepID=A0ABD3MI06_9STRA
MKVLQSLLLVLCHCALPSITDAFTNEPPGRDPASIENIRSSEKAVPLTSDNFDELTKGKIIFIKFYSPSCPHCKSMAGAWNELANYYQETHDNNNNNILIGSIDCTDSPKGKDLCGRFEIVGLPTLLFGDASLGGIYLEEYSGDKTFGDLKEFAIEHLVAKCNPGNLDACTPESRKDMEEYIAMSYSELNERISALEKKQEELKDSFKDMFAKLQKQYDEMLTEREIQIVKAKASAKLIQEVIATKAS